MTHEPGPGCGGGVSRVWPDTADTLAPAPAVMGGHQMTGTPPPPPQAILASGTFSALLSNDDCYLTIIVIAFKIFKF